MRIRISYRSALYALIAVLAVGLVTGLAGCGGGEEQSQAPTTEEKGEQPEQPTEQPKEEVVEQPEEGAGEQALIDKGKQLALQNGCLSCHSIDGTSGAGPTWKGLFGKERELEDGTTVTADEAYLRESILDPSAKVVKSYSAMPSIGGPFSDEQLQALIAYIKSLSE